MAQRIEEVMTLNPTVIPVDATLSAAARAMRDLDIGDVVVATEGRPVGIVTDRDIVVRALAEGLGPETSVREICTRELTTLPAKGSVDDAIELMREKSLRRLPVVNGDVLVGIVSIGDLARKRDPGSALAEISTAPPNR